MSTTDLVVDEVKVNILILPKLQFSIDIAHETKKLKPLYILFTLKDSL